MTRTTPDTYGVLNLFAGTYQGGGAAGLQSILRDADGMWTLADVYPGACNASFGVYSPRHDLHYLVDEQPSGAIGIHRWRGGRWNRLASLPTGGGDPCHVALDPSGRLLAVANYAGGSVSIVRLEARSGLPEGPAEVHANRGSGPDPRRQESPHAHWVGFDPHGRWLYQTDLGTDEILALGFDAAGRTGRLERAWVAPPGSGPRHLLRHPTRPDRLYVIGELASTLTVLDADGATLRTRCVLSTLPIGWRGDNIIGHIAIDAIGERLYVSNRGHDSIAVFALDSDGIPTLLQHAPAGGAYPRFFLMLEDHRLMVVANEKAQTVTVLPIATDGRLLPAKATLAIPGVAFIMRAPSRVHAGR